MGTPNRFYSSTAVATTLTGALSNSATTATVASTSGFPVSFPFTLILERNTANQEVVNVTAVAGLTLTISRGQDGTTAVAHTSGAAVEHGTSARDFTEPQAHMAATAAVHGVAGTFVDTTSAQTLTNKTLTAPAITAPTIATSDFGAAQHTHADAAHGGQLAAEGLTGSAWSTYTPVWTTAGTAPAVGNGTLLGAFKQIGKTVFFRLALLAGSTTTYGTGGWSFTLPVTAVSTLSGVAFTAASFVAAGSYPALAVLASTTTLTFYAASSTSSGALGSPPGGAGTTSQFFVTGCYEAA